MTTESLVVIRTFGDLLHADEAQIDLLTAGIYSLLFADDQVEIEPSTPTTQEIALAVHQRDVAIAEAVLTPRPPNPA